MNLHKLYRLIDLFYKKAVPLDLERIENIHDTDLRAAVPRTVDVLVYHGTSSLRLADIISHGSLDPAMSEANKSWPESSSGIFVSAKMVGFTSSGEMYSHHTSTQDGSDPVVLELQIPLNWIEMDPDDTKELEGGGINDAGKVQGVVRRPIKVSHIKNIFVKSEKIAQSIPSGLTNLFDKDRTEWMPIGKFLDVIKKLINKGVELPEEYHRMVGDRPKGLSRNQPYPEREQKLAQELEMVYSNFFDPTDVSSMGKGIYETALIWLYKDPSRVHKSAKEMMTEFLALFNQSTDRFDDFPEEYQPKEHESFIRYLARAK
jgi:hypothetical protein